LPEFAAAVKASADAGRTRFHQGGNNENRVFRRNEATVGEYRGLLFQWVTRPNSLLSGSIEYQLILAPNNEFKRPINRKTMEYVEAEKIGE